MIINKRAGSGRDIVVVELPTLTERKNIRETVELRIR